MRTLTVTRLIKAGACADQVKLFRRVFPKGAPITLKSIEAARRAELSYGWITNLLSGPARQRFYTDTLPAWERFYTDTATRRRRNTDTAAAAWRRYVSDTAPALLRALKETP